MYIAYKKADEGPVFSTVWLFTTIWAILVSFPVIVFCYQFFNINKLIFILIYLIISVVGVVITLRRYNKKKINEMLVKYRYYKCNKWLKNWMIYVGIVLFFPASLFLLPLWMYFFDFIQELIH
jgi:TM2 domain-containing membrane protein YozV